MRYGLKSLLRYVFVSCHWITIVWLLYYN